jgi:hypothetical protein
MESIQGDAQEETSNAGPEAELTPAFSCRRRGLGRPDPAESRDEASPPFAPRRAPGLDQTTDRNDWWRPEIVMSRCQNSSAFRLTTVVAMLLWLLGQTMCIQHCAQLAFTEDGHSCCAKKSGGPTKSSSGGGMVFCGSLKLAKLEVKTSLPKIAVLVTVPVTPAALFITPEPVAEHNRPAHLRAIPRADYVFLPEVSLGPALRTLAPPLARLS